MAKEMHRREPSCNSQRLKLLNKRLYSVQETLGTTTATTSASCLIVTNNSILVREFKERFKIVPSESWSAVDAD
jgi:pyrimidine deaminase RibD-like protein